MKKIAIIHFSPLELYPPVQNLIGQLEVTKLNGTRFYVITTSSAGYHLSVFRSNSSEVKLLCFGNSGQVLNVLRRYLNYVYFYSAALVHLIIHRPESILYFETLSSWPVYIYKKFIFPSCKILVHYHEYTSPTGYASGMKLTKYFHELEKWIYPRTVWVSHTNEFRMKKFISDIAPVTINNVEILPNYPPRSWMRKPQNKANSPLKVVYVGALSLDTMYLSEFANWVIKQNGDIVWEIFSTNITDQAKEYIEKLNYSGISLKKGINYSELPETLVRYDVGVILYKGHIPNYVYNAPNKMFEYLACGLDVWFPNVMLGSLPYQDIDHYPKVIAIDFTKLNELSRDELINRPAQKKTDEYFCEDILEPLVNKLNG